MALAPVDAHSYTVGNTKWTEWVIKEKRHEVRKRTWKVSKRNWRQGVRYD